jgi:transcriptional regulator with GAF, ATPase, and Fis domain
VTVKVIVVEDGVRTELDLPGPVVRVGRAIDNDIRLAGHQVSRHHCRIEADDGALWVVDLGSSNGTQVNGERVDRRLLGAGDQVRIGRAEISVVQEPAGPAAAEPVPSTPQDATVVASWRSAAADAAGEVGLQTLAGDARRERENLRVFAHITRQLLTETDVSRLLRGIVDSAVALVGAERGFLLLGETRPELDPREAGRLRPPPTDIAQMKVRVARSFDREDIPLPASRLSMGIALSVAQTRQPVLSVDAGRDARFDGMKSVEDLRLRSVLCLPLCVPAERGVRVDGVLYVDNRLQESAFSPDSLDLLTLLADQASIAIRNARLVAELREQAERVVQSSRKIELLNEQLGRKVRDRDHELSVVRAELSRERGRYDYSAIVGASEGMRRVFQQLDRIIESDLPVLIVGESGTGKELIARAIHFNSARKAKPFVSENCAALPDTLLESELFGHARGAFTGAHRSKKGLLEQANGGSLLLDEVGDMSPEMQKKLLRVLQEGEVRMLGSEQRIQVDVRVLAASHRDLEQMVLQGTFREDLYYRINVLIVHLPPLRERREDIALLAEALIARAARQAGRSVPLIPHEVMAALISYDWPGNVRELENEMRRLVVLSRDEVELSELSPGLREAAAGGPRAAAAPSALASGATIRDAVADLERRSIEAALEAADGNKSRAAAALGLSRFALQRKLEKYGRGTRAGVEDAAPPA